MYRQINKNCAKMRVVMENHVKTSKPSASEGKTEKELVSPLQRGKTRGSRGGRTSKMEDKQKKRQDRGVKKL